MTRWTEFFVTIGSASAALTGLLFVAVALRPRDIRHSATMLGRASAAFYAFVTVLLVTLLALTGTSSRLIGVAQVVIVLGVLVLQNSLTMRAWRSGNMSISRSIAFMGGMFVTLAAGIVRAAEGAGQDSNVVLAIGLVVLLAFALSNSWQLVISHEPDPDE
jgi:hypothetical protein